MKHYLYIFKKDSVTSAVEIGYLPVSNFSVCKKSVDTHMTNVLILNNSNIVLTHGFIA